MTVELRVGHMSIQYVNLSSEMIYDIILLKRDYSNFPYYDYNEVHIHGLILRNAVFIVNAQLEKYQEKKAGDSKQDRKIRNYLSCS